MWLHKYFGIIEHLLNLYGSFYKSNNDYHVSLWCVYFSWCEKVWLLPFDQREYIVERGTVAKLWWGWIMMSFSFQTSKAFCTRPKWIAYYSIKYFVPSESVAKRVHEGNKLQVRILQLSIPNNWIYVRVNTSQLFSLFSTSSISSAWNFYWAELLKTKDTKTTLGLM